MSTSFNLPPSLQWPINAFEAGTITHGQAVACIKAWPGCLPHEMATKARALRHLATLPALSKSHENSK